MIDFLNIDLKTLFLALALFFIAYLLFFKRDEKKDDSSLKLLQEQIISLNKTIDEKLREWNQMFSQNMSKTFETSVKISKESNRQIEELTKKLTSIEETNKQIKDIWSQLSWLENILKNPKQRWNLWEYFLKELLENVFSEWQYKMQFELKNGVVDAVLFIWEKIIPIDSKFPQENYERLLKSQDEVSILKYSKELKKDIKNRIDETSKYISPEYWTTDFAFMLIPAEWIYYDIFINKVLKIESSKIIEYGFSKKVIICSPSSFYAYLQTVMQWMKALEIEQKAKEIEKYVLKLQKDLDSYEDIYKKIWASINTTINHYNSWYKRLEIIDRDIVKINPTNSKNTKKDILELEKVNL